MDLDLYTAFSSTAITSYCYTMGYFCAGRSLTALGIGTVLSSSILYLINKPESTFR